MLKHPIDPTAEGVPIDIRLMPGTDAAQRRLVVMNHATIDLIGFDDLEGAIGFLEARVDTLRKVQEDLDQGTRGGPGPLAYHEVEGDDGISTTLEEGEAQATAEANFNAAESFARAKHNQRLKDQRDRCVARGEHKPEQHRDGKPPWCRACGLTTKGFDSDELGLLGRTREETARLGIKDPRNEPGKHDVSKANTGAGPGVPPSKPRFNPQPR